MLEFSALKTEIPNENTTHIDECETLEILRMMNAEDAKIAGAVGKELSCIAEAVDEIVKRMKNGGRLIYVGAGTSGRLGVLDASECPPTFGTDPEQVQAFIAGGEAAFTKSLESAEDDEEAGENLITEKAVRKEDAVVGITASGRTPYVLGALKAARRIGALTVGIANNDKARLKDICDISIIPDVGAEVIMGSTRLKAGTSQKMVLNMISTATMIKMGKVYRNLMVDMKPINEKLLVRTLRMLELSTGVDEETARKTLEISRGNLKAAIIMLKSDVAPEVAERVLIKSNGSVSGAIRSLQSKE